MIRYQSGQAGIPEAINLLTLLKDFFKQKAGYKQTDKRGKGSMLSQVHSKKKGGDRERDTESFVMQSARMFYLVFHSNQGGNVK
jgi:hypothetical protein